MRISPVNTINTNRNPSFGGLQVALNKTTQDVLQKYAKHPDKSVWECFQKGFAQVNSILGERYKAVLGVENINGEPFFMLKSINLPGAKENEWILKNAVKNVLVPDVSKTKENTSFFASVMAGHVGAFIS